ncbi:DUF397 domain-containing protein [Nocardia flavorosea]|uniref:DUF397 domain-containing protein n=1 Tax=Nocardia flavorosea TaxID=53429 RepID=A0A846YTT2_9NOCA|nr:DUF397 domain-containing protein [Nocardia flavorosea]NKY61051.1 DUF397 domain-containing protein [Nocardia flavorosea]
MRTDLSGASWFKSSYSQHGGECVEVAHMTDMVGVRDSKDPTGPALVFGHSEWEAFLRAVATDS